MIYFDNSATTFPKPEIVYRTMDRVFREYGVNAGRGGYRSARKASEIIAETRQLLANMVNISDVNNIIFTPSATIALNTVIFGLDLKENSNVYFTPFEHNSVLRPLEILKKKKGINLIQIPINKNNLKYDFSKLEEMFKQYKPDLLIVNHVSNVCGLVSPIKQLTNLTHKFSGLVLVDGSQALGLIPVDLKDIKCDFYVFAGHKNLYGPFGVGGIIINNDIFLEPIILGGTGSNSQELVMPSEYPKRIEAGSPNILSIAGLNAGLKWLKKQVNIIRKEKALLNEFLNILKNFPEIKVIGKSENMMPIISCVFEGFKPQEMAMVLDQNFDIAVRAGLHCAPLAHKFLGTFPLGTVRFSFGLFNSKEEILQLYDIFKEIFY